MVIYNSIGEKISVEIPDKPIRYVMVMILSGDETGIVTFDDYSTVYFDANPDRKVDDFQMSYIVDREKVCDWLNFSPTSKDNPVYDRAKAFEAEEV